MSDVPQAYLDHLAAVTGTGTAALEQCWEPEGVLEFPYATSVGTAQRLEGLAAIKGYFSGLGTFGGDWAFTDMHASKVEGGDEYVLEVHGSATVTETGSPYEQDYIVRFGLGPTGKLAWMREFWDPTRV